MGFEDLISLRTNLAKFENQLNQYKLAKPSRDVSNTT